MQYAEIDIIWDGGRAREVLEFRHGVGRLAMEEYVKELARKCGWKDVRLSVGRDWTGWLFGSKK